MRQVKKRKRNVRKVRSHKGRKGKRETGKVYIYSNANKRKDQKSKAKKRKVRKTRTVMSIRINKKSKENQVTLFLAGAVVGDLGSSTLAGSLPQNAFLRDSRSTKACAFQKTSQAKSKLCGSSVHCSACSVKFWITPFWQAQIFGSIWWMSLCVAGATHADFGLLLVAFRSCTKCVFER